MDNYKKKSLKFSGLGRDIRVAELSAARRTSRLQRFSLLRPIDDISTDEDPKENIPASRIPTFGNQKSQTTSRVEMLKKWKNEKLLKKKVELQSKKPAFKIGLAPLKLEPSTASFNKFNRFGLSSRIQGSDISSNLKHSKVSNADAKGSVKISFSGVSKPIIQKPAVPSRLLPQKQQILTTKTKGPTPAYRSNPQTSTTKPKGPTPVYRSNPQTSTTKSKGPTPANQSNPQTSTTKSKGPTPANQSNPQTSTTKSKGPTPANQSNPQTSTTKPKGPTPANRSNPQIPKSKPTIQKLVAPSLLPQRKQQISNLKPKEKIPAKQSNPQNQPNKLNKPGIKNSNPVVKSANPAQVKQLGTTFRKPAEISVPGKVQPKKIADKSSASEGQNSMFLCQLSVIEPVEVEKSFAPEGFVFHPPTGLQTSWSLVEDGPLEIYAKVKKEMEENIRTSTPKRQEWNECQDQKDDSYILATSFTVESSTAPTSKTRSSSVSSSDTKYIECLLDNSPSEIKSSVPNSPQNKLLEQAQAPEILTTKENPEEIHPEVDCLETQQPELISPEAVPLEIMHLQLNALETDVKPEQSCIASPIVSSDAKDYGIISGRDSEQARPCQNGSSEVCLPVLNEPKVLASALCLPKDDSAKIPDLNVLGMDQEKISLSEKFDKRFTRSHRRTERPSLLKISESPENREAAKANQMSSACAEFTHPQSMRLSESPEYRETPKTRQKSSAYAEFTPRRSMRLARKSQFNSVENLFDVKPFFQSPGKESLRLTEDFTNLNLESLGDTTEEPRMSTRSSTAHNSDISLLYTPPRRRASTRNKMSLAGDLMTFSPYV